MHWLLRPELAESTRRMLVRIARALAIGATQRVRFGRASAPAHTTNISNRLIRKICYSIEEILAILETAVSNSKSHINEKERCILWRKRLAY